MGFETDPEHRSQAASADCPGRGERRDAGGDAAGVGGARRQPERDAMAGVAGPRRQAVECALYKMLRRRLDCMLVQSVREGVCLKRKGPLVALRRLLPVHIESLDPAPFKSSSSAPFQLQSRFTWHTCTRRHKNRHSEVRGLAGGRQHTLAALCPYGVLHCTHTVARPDLGPRLEPDHRELSLTVIP